MEVECVQTSTLLPKTCGTLEGVTEPVAMSTSLSAKREQPSLPHRIVPRITKIMYVKSLVQCPAPSKCSINDRFKSEDHEDAQSHGGLTWPREVGEATLRAEYFLQFASVPAVSSVFPVISEFTNYVYPSRFQIKYHLLHEAFWITSARSHHFLYRCPFCGISVQCYSYLCNYIIVLIMLLPERAGPYLFHFKSLFTPSTECCRQTLIGYVNGH